MTKILDETGYPEVAERFRGSSQKAESLLDSSDKSTMSDIISKRTGLSGTGLKSVMSSVLAALDNLGIAKCSPQLAVELARHYKDTLHDYANSLKSPNFMPLKKSSSAFFLAEPEDFLAKLDGKYAALIRQRIISVRPLSRLFPSLGLEIRLEPFASSQGIEKPTTEMTLIPKLNLLAEAIEAIATEADSFCTEAGKNDCVPLPLWLDMADISAFSSAWLGYGPEGLERASREITATLLASLSRTPFKTTLI